MRGKDLDYSDKAAEAMYVAESCGGGSGADVDSQHLRYLMTGERVNGYAVGKRWMDVTVAGWFDEMERFGWGLVLTQLYRDPELPRWFLDKVFARFLREREGIAKEMGEDVLERYRRDIVGIKNLGMQVDGGVGVGRC